MYGLPSYSMRIFAVGYNKFKVWLGKLPVEDKNVEAK